MKYAIYLLLAISAMVTACTVEKTDYEAEIATDTTEYFEFEEVTTIKSGDYNLTIEALNGTLYKGYNEIHINIVNAQTDEQVKNADVTFLPILTDANGNKSSCPHEYTLSYDATNDYYLGYSVFTDESSTTSSWDLYIDFTISNNSNALVESVSVEEQVNKNLNMTAFTGNDNVQYFIALVAPQRPDVAENDLVAGIYKYIEPTQAAGDFPDPSQFTYAVVNDHTLLLDPRMPEPSMGNHSSPNNEDLTQQNDERYHGVVNYTMTGNWTLNFIFQDANGKTIKGTEVPTDFTPGIEGVKSELYIDILF
ncbi:hypothetical protein Q4566_13180 [Tamlana sp. 2_MG-2023]|uniref:hypothetical protein n=1 Tax=unclassified Tamlana TaxID=2614803 RepID=UPI0026E12C26|nr:MULTISPECIES: hypothetical protein [unclassified Tamlana]MDO6761158.1 hypothetical protein [Tamlana sp. 2_MG-2023]MDO6791509.1 hypothetical protein [Tamlana sp. 1_MG-2023]